MKAEETIITPTRAASILAHNTLNRPVSQAAVDRYAQDMREGRWMANGQTIVISDSDELLDGQHRLHAIIKSGVAQPMLLVEGIARSAFVTIDNGRARNLADVLGIQGWKNTRVAAAIARAAYSYAGGATFVYTANRTTLSQFATDHPYIQEVASMVQHNLGNLPRSPIGAVVFLGNCGRQYDDKAKEFIEGLGSGQGLWKGDPRFTLREWIIAQRAKFGVPTETVFIATARAWNAWAKGDDLSLLKYLTDSRRNKLPIVGFDRSLFQDVPELTPEATQARTRVAHFSHKTPGKRSSVKVA